MCSFNNCNIFKEKNIESIIFKKWNTFCIRATITYKSGKNEDIIIRRGKKYKSDFISSLEEIFNTIKNS